MFEVMDHRAGGGDCLRHVRAAEAVERFDPEMLAQREAGVLGQKGVTVVLERVINPAELFLLLGAD